MKHRMRAASLRFALVASLIMVFAGVAVAAGTRTTESVRHSNVRIVCVKRRGERHRLCRPARAAKRSKHAIAPTAKVTVGPCANTGITPSAANLDTVQTATLCLINQVRAEHHLAPLRENDDLQQAALGHNNDMVARDYFDHTDPSGGTPLSRIEATGYIANQNISYLIGENIAWGTLSLSTPAAIVNAWVNSPDHLANILDATYTQTGLAVAAHAPPSLAQGQQGAIYTQDFGGVDTGSG